jgi:hypothetical protein
MKEVLELCCSPVYEDCAQVGSEDYYVQVKKECRALINQLRRQFGNEPPGCILFIKSNSHDFGTYHEVAAKFDDNNEEAIEYAYKIESNLPLRWDEEAKKELNLK